MKVTGTRSGNFDFKEIDTGTQINHHKTLTNVDTDNLKSVNLELFPVVNDFEILLTKKNFKGKGKHIYFYSANRNEQLTSILWWNDAETFLKEWNKWDIPTGTIDEPFFDLKEGGKMIIFEHKGFIYILESSDYQCENNIINTWYKIPKEVYFNEWKNSLKLFIRKGIKVIGTKSGEFSFKGIDTYINHHETLTNINIHNLKDLNLELFPIVKDLEVLISKKKLKRRGKHISLYSASRNEQLTTFHRWDCAEVFLKDWSSSNIPTGTIDEPFSNFAEGWQMIVFEDKGFIYVLEGERESNIMLTWYRTPKEVYFNEWSKLIKRYKRKNEHIKVIGTKSGEFDFKREDIFTDSLINNNETLTNVVIDNLKNLNLELFPVVNDFELLITKKRVKHYSEFVYFYSRSKNENLTTFEYWKNAKTFLKDFKKRDIPTGTIDNPFSDFDQGWQIIIFEENGFIYVLQGGEFDHENNTIHTWYRTSKEAYFNEWGNLLKKFK
ncbi:hypothetical protein ACMGD3_17910 [Lysinibacillus sphaericus]|uniref:hypothetical protein n=1 Tax=Lysinibacillus sphaericus TaxID=1421 RepID=UPI003F79A1BD